MSWLKGWRREVRRLGAVAALAAAALGFVVLSGLVGIAARGPGWAMVRGDGANSGQLPAAVGAGGPRVSAWTGLDPVVAGPLVDGEGRLYIGHGNKIGRYDASGVAAWEQAVGALAAEGLALAGPSADRSGRVYVLTTDPQMLRCYDAADGTLLWFRFLYETPAAGPAVADCGTVVFGTGDGRFRGYRPNGELAFQTRLGNAICPRPAVTAGEGIYVTVRGGAVHRLTPSGQVVWRRIIGANISYPPAADPAGGVWVVDECRRAHRFDAQGGHLATWSLPAAPAGWPAVHPQLGLLCPLADGSIHAVTTAGGTEVIAAGTLAGPVWLFVDGAGHLLYTDGATVRAITADGGELWRGDVGGVAGAPAWANGGVLVGTDQGSVVTLTTAAAPVPPELPRLLLPDPSPDGWHRHGRIRLEPAGLAAWPAGVELWWEALSGGQTATGLVDQAAGMFDVPGQGEVAVRLCSGDLAGPWHSLRIDTEPPEIRVNYPINGAKLPLGIILRPRLVATDAGSGVAHVRTYLGGAAFTGPAAPGPGQHSLAVEVLDRAGNRSRLIRRFTVGEAPAALCLNPVLVGPSRGGVIPVWSRWVTVLLRVPAALAAAGTPGDIQLGEVDGRVVARLPVRLTSRMRSYLVRFDRPAVAQQLDSLAAGGTGRFAWVQLPVKWACGDQSAEASVRVLYRR